MTTSATSLFDNPILSDVRIRQIHDGQVKEYHGHKAILCYHSKYFMRAFTGNFKEASENFIELRCDDPNEFQMMLEYCYSGDLPTLDAHAVAAGTWTQELTAYIVTHLGIYALANKYDMEGLKSAISVALNGIKWQRVHLTNKIWVEDIVHAHYKTCSQVACPMQPFMYSVFYHHSCATLRQSRCLTDLVRKYPAFGADLWFETKATKGL